MGAVLAWVGLFAILPSLRLGFEAFAPGLQAFSAAPATTVLGSASTWTATLHSLWVSLLGALFAMLLGGSAALVVGLTDLRRKTLASFLFVLPLLIAPQVIALAWLQLLGPTSTLLKAIGLAPAMGRPNPLYGPGGIAFLLGLQQAPLVFLTLRAGLRSLPGEAVEAALNCRARPMQIVVRIILPLMAPTLLAGLTLAFVSCLGNFGIPAFLGIPGNYLVLPTLIYQKLAALGPTVLPEVAVLALLTGALALLALLLQARLLRGQDSRVAGLRPFHGFALGRYRRLAEGCLLGYGVAILALPFLALLLNALVPAAGVPLTAQSATFENFRFVLFEHAASQRAVWNSLWLSAAAAACIMWVATPLAYFMVWRSSAAMRIAAGFMDLPYAVPGVVLAVAAILLFIKPLPLLGVSIYNTAWIILFCYLSRFLVIGLKPVVASLQQLDPAMDHAAQSLGANLVQRVRLIHFPLLAPSAFAGAVLVMLIAFNELTVSALLWSSGAETLGVTLYAFQNGGESGLAAALAVLTILFTLLLVVLADRLGSKLPKGVIPWRA